MLSWHSSSVYHLGSKIPSLETHDQNVSRDGVCKRKSGHRGPSRTCTVPTPRGKGRREVPSMPRAGGHKGTKTREVSKMRCSGPGAQHIPCWGEIGPERERKQMRGPSRETRGNSRHSRESRLENMRQQGRGEVSSVWPCAKIPGGKEGGGLCSAGMRIGPKPNAKELLSVCLSTKGHLIRQHVKSFVAVKPVLDCPTHRAAQRFWAQNPQAPTFRSRATSPGGLRLLMAARPQ